MHPFPAYNKRFPSGCIPRCIASPVPTGAGKPGAAFLETVVIYESFPYRHLHLYCGYDAYKSLFSDNILHDKAPFE